MGNKNIAYILARLGIAASMLSHGLVRLPKLEGFSKWMVGNFEKSILPKLIVIPFSYALPILELIIGVLLFIGLFTKQNLILGAIVMIVLIFGSGMIEEWGAIPSQLIHLAFFAILLIYINHNRLCFDKIS